MELDPAAGNDWSQEEKGMIEGEMVGWHHQLNGHEFEQALGVGDGQEGLVRCSPWGHRVRHDWVTELTWTEMELGSPLRVRWRKINVTHLEHYVSLRKPMVKLDSEKPKINIKAPLL